MSSLKEAPIADVEIENVQTRDLFSGHNERRGRHRGVPDDNADGMETLCRETTQTFPTDADKEGNSRQN